MFHDVVGSLATADGYPSDWFPSEVADLFRRHLRHGLAACAGARSCLHNLLVHWNSGRPIPAEAEPNDVHSVGASSDPKI